MKSTRINQNSETNKRKTSEISKKRQIREINKKQTD